MDYFDPGRPMVSHRPAYVGPTGRTIAPLPPLTIIPLPNARLTLGMWLLVDASLSARYFSIDIDKSALADYISEWIANPETFMAHHYGYRFVDGPAFRPASPSPPLSLADLGL